MFFRFESPWVLALLILPILIGMWPLLNRRRHRPATLRYADTTLTATGGFTWRIAIRPMLPIMRMLTLALVIIALARPQTGQAQEIIRGEGVDIALALDISGSMDSLDFEPDNRLVAAKQVIADFITARQYDRIGLVVFASNAFNQSPPTIDYTVLLRLLDQVQLSYQLNLDAETAIGLGLASAANMLKDSTAESKVVVLLTDGVNNSGQIDPLTAAEAAKTLGIRVYTIGMGRTGQVPRPVQDIFGRQSISYQESDLDEETLQQIAELTGGLYFRAEDTAGLQQVYDEINELEASDVEITSYTIYQELAIWLLQPALLLFVLEMLLRQTLLRKIP